MRFSCSLDKPREKHSSSIGFPFSCRVYTFPKVTFYAGANTQLVRFETRIKVEGRSDNGCDEEHSIVVVIV